MKKILIVLNTHELFDSFFEMVEGISRKTAARFDLLHVLPEKFRDNKNNLKALERVKTRLEEGKVEIGEHRVKYGEIVENVLQDVENFSPELVVTESGKITKKSNLDGYILDVIKKSGTSVWSIQRTSTPGIKQVLCPVDFSDLSKQAFQNAIQFSKVFQAELVVITVSEEVESTSVFMKQSYTDVNKESYKYSEQQLDDLLEENNTSGISVRKEIRQGKPAEEILNAVEDVSPDLLFMGTHGRSGIKKLLIGSVAEKVLKEDPCAFIAIHSPVDWS